MKGKLLFILISAILLGACSESKSKEESTSDSYEVSSKSNKFSLSQQDSASLDKDMADTTTSNQNEVNSSLQMIIHNAQLFIEVNDIEMAQQAFEKMATDYKGYIVESTIFRNDNKFIKGTLIVRIPEMHFESFLSDTEETATINERNVTGKDVTEQYVDLQSRIKTKRAVEERLLEFMSNAEKTEDLLKISSDLAIVQEEIEIIVGKMNYLENQSAYSTIEIEMFKNSEDALIIGNKNLNTWDKTKKQLISSSNFIFSAGSALIVFTVGNLPVLVLLGIIGVGCYFIIKRGFKNKG